MSAHGIRVATDATAVQGWLLKHKRGFSVSRWFALQKNMLVFYKSPSVPYNYVSGCHC